PTTGRSVRTHIPVRRLAAETPGSFTTPAPPAPSFAKVSVSRATRASSLTAYLSAGSTLLTIVRSLVRTVRSVAAESVSPPMSPNSVSELAASMRSLQIGKVNINMSQPAFGLQILGFARPEVVKKNEVRQLLACIEMETGLFIRRTLMVVLFCMWVPMKVIGRTRNASVSSSKLSVVNIGALYTFNSVIGRSAKPAIEAAVDDVNSDSTVLAGNEIEYYFA
ncbi:hypothetical protein HYC85_004103, partial [Camellia sinensis]